MKSKEGGSWEVSMMANEKFTCDCCEENLPTKLLACGDFFEENKVCKTCVSEYYYSCQMCERLIHCDSNEIYYSQDDRLFCRDCYNDNFHSCERCEAEVRDGYECEECEVTSREDGRWNCNFRFIEGDTMNENKSDRFVGVEIEAIGGESSSVSSCDDFVSCKYDGSIEDGDEFSTNPMNKDILFENIRKLCKSIRGGGYGIDTNCGLHIHIDTRDFSDEDLRKAYLVYHRFEKFFFEMVPTSRRNNNYCRTLRQNYEKSLEMPIKNYIYRANPFYDMKSFVSDRWDNNRYYWFNINSAFSNRKTIEIRLHNGTIDSEKIINWIRINLKIIEWIKKTDIKRVTSVKNKLDTFLNIVEDDDLKKYIIARRKKFSKKIPRIKIENIKQRLKNKSIDNSIKLFHSKREEELPIISMIRNESIKIVRRNMSFDLGRAGRCVIEDFRRGFGFNYPSRSIGDIVRHDYERFHNFSSKTKEKAEDFRYSGGIIPREYIETKWRRFNKNVRNTINV